MFINKITIYINKKGGEEKKKKKMIPILMCHPKAFSTEYDRH